MDMVIYNNVANNVKPKRTSMGRRKIALDRKIEKKFNLLVTFTKRRQGMFKKVAQLSLRSGAEMAILVRSPVGKIFTFGSPSADAVIRHFKGEAEPSGQIVEYVEGRIKKEENLEKRDQMWWNKPFESMGLDELWQFALDLEDLQSRIPL